MTTQLTASREHQLVAFLGRARPSANRLARSLRLPPADVEDALHDFVVVLLQRPELIDGYHYPQKLVSVLRRLLNQAKRTRRHIGLDDAMDACNSQVLLVSFDGIHLLAAQESLDQLHQLATERERYILELAQKDLTVPQIAEALSVTVQAIHNALYRLRRRWWSVFGGNGAASKAPSRRATRSASKSLGPSHRTSA